MRNRVFFTLLLIALSSIKVMAADEKQSFEELFSQGVAAYQTKDYEKARDLLSKSLEADHRNTAAMSDLALSYYQLGDKGQAIGWFRRALALDPQQPEARAGLRFALNSLEIKEIPHRIETFESIRENFLQSFQLKHLLGLTGIFLLGFGWLLLTWLGSRQRALRADDIPPAFPWSVGLLGTLFVLSLLSLILKIYDANLPRGTVVGKLVPARSLPSENGVTIFELHEGFEVLLGEFQEKWVQVTYPGGLTGWIPSANLLAEKID